MSRFVQVSILILLAAPVAAASSDTPASLGAARADVFTEPAAAPVGERVGNEVRLFPPASYYWTAETTKTVNVDSTPSETNYTMIVAGNTLGGALVGFLIGGAIYLLQDPDDRRRVNLAWWTGAGALVGVGAGVIQVIVSANRDSNAVSSQDTATDHLHRVLSWTQDF